jgi:hypothetical protein
VNCKEVNTSQKQKFYISGLCSEMESKGKIAGYLSEKHCSLLDFTKSKSRKSKVT